MSGRPPPSVENVCYLLLEYLFKIRDKLSRRQIQSESIQMLIESLRTLGDDQDAEGALGMWTSVSRFPTSVESLLRLLREADELDSSHHCRADPRYATRQRMGIDGRLAREARKLMEFFEGMGFEHRSGEGIREWTPLPRRRFPRITD